MGTWKIVENLTEPFDPSWHELARLTLGDKVHPERKMGFMTARMALKLCLANLGYALSPLELSLSSFSQIKVLPDLTISLSHTKGYGAALVCKKEEILSCGIDIEREDRFVKPEIVSLMSHPQDVRLRNIELWSIKEAVFKALMNTGKFQKYVDFGDLEIKEDRWTHSPSGLKGEWEMEILNQLVVSRAFLRN